MFNSNAAASVMHDTVTFVTEKMTIAPFFIARFML